MDDNFTEEIIKITIPDAVLNKEPSDGVHLFLREFRRLFSLFILSDPQPRARRERERVQHEHCTRESGGDAQSR